MNERVGDTGYLAGAMPLETLRPCFALPVIQGEAPENYLVQEVDETSGRVTRFRELRGFQPSELVEGPEIQRLVSVGDEQSFCFLTTNGRAKFGNLREIRSALEEALPSARPTLRLQIMELIGSGADLRQARREVRAILAERGGLGAARSYQSSVLSIILWDKLLAHASNGDVVDHLLRSRRSIYVRTNMCGEIDVEFGDLDLAEFGDLNVGELLAELSSEFEQFESDTDTNAHDDPIVELEFSPSELKAFLNRRLRSDLRISDWTYQWATRWLATAGIGSLRQLESIMEGYDADELSQVATQARQGQITKLELILIAAFGDKPPSSYPFFTVRAKRILNSFRLAGIQTGTVGAMRHPNTPIERWIEGGG